MKIAYILYPEVIVSNKSNGIRSQAECWASLLEERGHTIVRVNDWENYNWSEFDIIHVFADYHSRLIERLSIMNPNICISPIKDPLPSLTYTKESLKYRLSVLTKGRGIFASYYRQKKQLSYAKKILVRSTFEGDYLSKVFDLPKERFELVPLSVSTNISQISTIAPKDNICFHMSSIYQSRKNVIRLINAAKKYDFELYLAGNSGNEPQFAPLKSAIGNAKNIHVLGFISEEAKLEWYRRAKVFALPSLSEGVGIVALDAALCGCEIVITNIKGPKEYYHGLCQEVSPYDVDEIGKAVVGALNGRYKFQPELSKLIIEKYSPSCIADKLESTYQSML